MELKDTKELLAINEFLKGMEKLIVEFNNSAKRTEASIKELEIKIEKLEQKIDAIQSEENKIDNLREDLQTIKIEIQKGLAPSKTDISKKTEKQTTK